MNRIIREIEVIGVALIFLSIVSFISFFMIPGTYYSLKWVMLSLCPVFAIPAIYLWNLSVRLSALMILDSLSF